MLIKNSDIWSIIEIILIFFYLLSSIIIKKNIYKYIYKVYILLGHYYDNFIFIISNLIKFKHEGYVWSHQI